MLKKNTLLLLLLTVCYGLAAQNDEPCNATTLTVHATCALADTTQGRINPPAFTNSTNASSGVTLPALTCNGFTTTTRDFWYKCVVPASGKIIISTDYGNDYLTGWDTWDMAVYAANGATCAGSTFTKIGEECLSATATASNFPYARLSGLTAGATVYIRMWLEAAEIQTDDVSFGIFVVDGAAPQPPTCATPVSPTTTGTPLTSDPRVTWANDPQTQLFDVYYGASNVVANMYTSYDNLVSSTYLAQEFAYLPHAFQRTTPIVLLQPNATNYWFVHQRNCATDPNFVPNCASSSFTAAVVPTNDDCAGAVALSASAASQRYSSASAAQSQAAVTCAGLASSTASDVWFKFQTTAAGGAVTINVSPSAVLDGVIEAFSGTCGALTSLKCADETIGGVAESLNLTGLTPNTIYYVRVYGYRGRGFLYGEAFDITITGNTVIPVELVDFTAKTQGVKNALNWQTASERNAQSFIVERSADGEKGFSAIGTIKAAGTTSTPQYYAFLDENPLPVSYYRLRQVDLDGKSAVSKIVTVQRKDKRLSLEKAFPMPATNELTVQYSAERSGVLSLQLVDVFGRLILTQNVAATEGGNIVKLTLDNVATGAYVLLLSDLSDGLKVSQMRIVKQ